MFVNIGLFKNLPCPDREKCNRRSCLFCHSSHLPTPRPLTIPRAIPQVLPIKRPALPASPEPPRKFQKVGSSKRSLSIPSTSSTSISGAPSLRVNAALSIVPVPVRQTMLKTLYDHFSALYKSIIPSEHSLAAEHALRQEEEVYKKSTKTTYRNAVIQCVAALKKRPTPLSVNHPSVGTEEDISSRGEAQRAIETVHLSGELLEPLIPSLDVLQSWSYFIDVPPGPGGDEPSLEDKIAKCERCLQYFLVKADFLNNCDYHWGKPYMTRANGEKIRIYSCCSRPVTENDACSHGPHVFSDSLAQDLHSRHPFSFLPISDTNKPMLDVVALDCEMVYTTGGMRVARLSVVDGAGKNVFDEFIRMDDTVHVIDYNTRFSGITAENQSNAAVKLASVRESLNFLIDRNTIIIGHGLENDLKTLRIIHHRCIDTAILFPHKAGAPYRRSLKDLVREKLGKVIQTGDATQGHSSIEDASASLDLVRWHLLNNNRLT